MSLSVIPSTRFELIKTDAEARRGRLHLKHGVVETPIFMPVGTVGSVKTLTPSDLVDLNAQIILGNIVLFSLIAVVSRFLVSVN